MDNNKEKKTVEKEHKPVSWKYDIREENDNNYVWVSSNAALDDNASRYMFEVRRYKISATKEEYLNVKVHEIKRDENGELIDYDECAEIGKVSIIDLESKLLDLRRYGIIMERKHFPKVRQEIEKAYPLLTKRYVDDDTTITDDVILSVYNVFVRFIKEFELKAENGLYNIPVVDFKEHLLDSEFGKYKYSDIKAGLAKLKIPVSGNPVNATKCNFGRNDNTVKIGSKLVKVISFVEEVVNYHFTNLPNENT